MNKGIERSVTAPPTREADNTWSPAGQTSLSKMVHARDASGLTGAGLLQHMATMASDNQGSHQASAIGAATVQHRQESTLGPSPGSHQKLVQFMRPEIDYGDLARQLQQALVGGSPDKEVLVDIFKQVPADRLQSLIGAYNSINPSKPLLMHLKEVLDESTYLHVMDAACATSVAESSTPLLMGNTTESGYNLRADASTSAPIIGVLNFTSMPIQVTGKGTSGLTWYRITFKNPSDYAAVTAGHNPPESARDIMASHSAWVTADAVSSYVPWHVFMSQLNAFDVFTYDKNIQEKVTMLRQMAHPSDLPFDAIIGTDAGSMYEDQRDNHHALFQLLMDGKAIQTPNGEVVDIYHFIVGLDAYNSTRRHANASPNMFNSDVGLSDAAATWAGDLGAAAADALIEASSAVERHMDGQASGGVASDPDRLDYYYRSRAPEADLLADIDAWGAYQQVENMSALTVTEVVNGYYGLQTGDGARFSEKRKESFQRFLGRYGLITAGGTAVNAFNKTLLSKQIGKFAISWLQNKQKAIFPKYNEATLKQYCGEMADRFLQFIETHGKANGAF